MPSMLLQPIVENCLKHGLAPKLEGGRILLRTDDAGSSGCTSRSRTMASAFPRRSMPHVYVEGIGLSNVRERLRVLYGTDFHLDIQSNEGQGTTIHINVPELVPVIPEVSVF